MRNRIVLWLGSAIGLLGCYGEPTQTTPVETTEPIGSLEQALSTAQCRIKLTECLDTAADNNGANQCAADFQVCLNEQPPQAETFSACVADTNDCLAQATDSGDVRECRDQHADCTTRVLNGLATDFSITVGGVSTTPSAAFRLTRNALGIVRATGNRVIRTAATCEANVVSCVGGVLTQLDLRGCLSGLTNCADSVLETAEDTLERVVDVGDSVIEATLECRDEVRVCLSQAVTNVDVRGCRGLLRTCVDAVGNIGEEPAPNAPDAGAPPKPVNDCGELLSGCLGSPLKVSECANRTRRCLLGN
jgi:hypothetical protein